MSDYKAKDAAFTSTANSIRSKTGSSSLIQWDENTGFKTAIDSIVVGAGSAISIVDTADSHGGTIRTITGVSLAGDTVTAAHLESGYTAHDAQGNAITGSLVPSSGVDIPTFTGVYVNGSPPSFSSLTCNKTFAECVEFYADETYGYAILVVTNNVATWYESLSVRSDDWPPTELYFYSGTITANLIITYSSNGNITYEFGPIPENDSTDLSASGATVTAPAGYYENNATYTIASGTEGTPTATKGTVSSNSVTVTPSVTNTAGYISGGTHTGTAVTVSASELVSGTKNITTSGTTDVTNYASASVAAGSVTSPSTISGTSAAVSTGTNTLTLTKTVSVTPSVTTAGYISSGTAGDSSVSLTASVTTQAAQTIHPSTSDQSIAASRYLTGAQTIKAVTMANLTADNIKSGVTVKIGDSTDDDCVASVTGTYSGGSSKAVYTYSGLVSRTANSYGATNAKVTVTKAGTYNISFVAVRGSSSGTMGTNLHIGSTEKGNNTTWNNGTYGQSVSYTNQSISANTDVTIYATSGSNSRAIHVGQLIVEEV